MYVGTDPLLFNNQGLAATLYVDSGSSVTYDLDPVSGGEVGTLTAGQSASITTPVWVRSAGQSQVHIETAASGSAGGGATPTATKTANYTAAAGELVRVDASASSRMVVDAVTTSASPTLTSATANFTSADIGAPISGLGIDPNVTILSVQSTTSVTMSVNATASGTGVTVVVGSAKVTVTLPASAAVGTVVSIKKLDSTSKQVVVAPSGADTIDGLASITIGQQYRARRLVKDSSTTWVAEGGLSPDVTRPVGNIVDWIGDSISPQSSNLAVGLSSMNGSGKFDDYLWWAHLLSNAKIVFGKAAGIGSTRADHMLARVHDQALREPGHFLGIQTGTNDASKGITPAQFATTIKAIAAIAVSSGRIPILCTPPPCPSPFRYAQDQYRRFLSAYARDNGWPLIDFYSLLVDPATGNYLSTYDSGDNTHPNTAGKKAMGQLIATTLAPWLTPWTPPIENANTPSANIGVTGTALSSTLLPNGLFTIDTAGAVTPTSWTKSGTQTYSVVANEAGISGQSARIVDSASSGFSQISTSNLPGTTTGRGGHRIAFTGKVKVNGTGAVGPNLQCQLSAPSGNVLLRALSVFAGVATPGWQQFYVEGTAPSDCNGITVTLSSNGGTNVDAQIAQLGVYDLTANGY